MADTTNKRSLWITAGAAAATIVVILGIAVGPSVVSCASSADGFGACMGRTLSGSGASEPEGAETPKPMAEEAGTPTEMAAPAEVADTGVTDPEALAPRLGLVRAEPDGSVVIAGSAEPGAKVEIYANGELLGSTTTESSGDWVFVPDTPLPPGGSEITVSQPMSGQLAAESVVVVIQDDLSTEPLVVASTPGEASEILQGLTADAPEATAQTAEATAAVVAEQPAGAENMEIASAEASQPEPDAGSARVLSTEPVQTAEETPADTGKAAEETTAEVAMTDPADAAEMTAEAPVAAAAVTPPTIDAIEVEGDRNFFAGAGEEGATVRLYVDNEFVADSTVSDGRWLVETDRDYLTSPNQRVRVDMLSTGGTDVAARAEVDFAIEQAPETPGRKLATAAAEAAKSVKGAVDSAVDQVNQAVSTLGSGELASPPKIAVEASEDQPAAAPAMAETGSEVAETPAADTPEAAEQVEIPTVEIAAATEPEETEEPATEAEVPTMTAVQVGDAEDQRFASGKAIIRRGDNLWTIATRVYGSGYRYITIYRANQGQIRDPDLIYPGQVFDLPEDDS